MQREHNKRFKISSSNRFAQRIKNNFFSSPVDCIITLSLTVVIVFTLISIFNWILFQADWNIVRQNIPTYFFGIYPENERWRPTLLLIILLILIIPLLIRFESKYLASILKPAWIILLPFGLILLAGGFGLTPVPTRNWGGLILTFTLTLFSSLISLPLGIILAFGRQSNLRIINKICSTYIDVMRAFPLITVLFFGQLLIPLFLPMEVEINRVTRAILAFSLFTSAYIAEDIRGGIQSVPSTQKEASLALGFSKRQTMQIIILPQALRTALPALTNQSIGLLQNTSLMAILGLVELMGIGRSLLADPQFIGRYLELYIWLAFVYWIICTILALLSRQLETKLNSNIISK